MKGMTNMSKTFFYVPVYESRTRCAVDHNLGIRKGTIPIPSTGQTTNEAVICASETQYDTVSFYPRTVPHSLVMARPIGPCEITTRGEVVTRGNWEIGTTIGPEIIYGPHHEKVTSILSAVLDCDGAFTLLLQDADEEYADEEGWDDLTNQIETTYPVLDHLLCMIDSPVASAAVILTAATGEDHEPFADVMAAYNAANAAIN